jgi:hypothetical protein
MLTPKGLAEKSRLAMTRLSDSLTFVRAARGEFAAVFAEAETRQWQSTLLVGSSTLAEICILCAMERGLKIVAIVAPEARASHILGFPVYPDFASITEPFDGAVIAELHDPGTSLKLAKAALSDKRILIPAFLKAILPRQEAA